MTNSLKNAKNSRKFIAYYRVSTERQGHSGLGLEAELEKALKECKRRGATLVIARLDRLARNVHFVSGLMERKVPFVAEDNLWDEMFTRMALYEMLRVNQAIL